MSSAWLLNQLPYPNHPKLSPAEELGVLRAGPLPAWLRPFAEHAHVAPRRSSRPWGYVHICNAWGESSPAWELVGYNSPERLSWGLEVLFRQHTWDLHDVDGLLNDHECHGVFYWLPGDPRLLPLPLGVTR